MMMGVRDQFAPGTMLGRYELLAPIGEGGMARVLLARTRGPAGFEKVVVIKVVHPRMARDEAFVGMLLDEARVAAQINHQNVVQTYELGEAHGTFYIVMEYLAGESFARVLKNASQHQATHPMHPALASRVVADACDGLHAAHELTDATGRNAGVIHRDVSLGNIVVLYNGGVKVVDFGIAKANDRMTSTTQDGQLKGKYAYMSPEQIQNQPMDRRSDVFSLGVVLWESLTLRRLFQTESVAATLMQIVGGERVPPSTYRPTVTPELDAITLKALAPDPRDRFQSCAEMRRAIEDAIWQVRCGSDEVGGYMQTMFAERIEQRRTLLATAARESVPLDGELRIDEGSGSVLKPPSLPTSAPSYVPPRRGRKVLGGLVIVAGMALGLAAGITLIRAGHGAGREALGAPVTQPTKIGDGNSNQGGVVPQPQATGSATTIATPPPDDMFVESTMRAEHEIGDGAPGTLAAYVPPKVSTSAPPSGSGSAKPKADPGEAQALFDKGTAAYMAGDLLAATVAFRAAAERGYAPAYRALGRLYERTGNTPAALAAYRTYSKLVPGDKDVKERIANLGGE